MVPDRKITSGHHMSDAGIFVRPCSESRRWGIRSLSSHKLIVSSNTSAVRDPNTRHAQLALSGDLVGRHGSLNTSPDAYRASAQALFASHLGELPSAPVIVDGPLTGVPIALVPAPDADGDHVLVLEPAWPSLDARPEIAGQLVSLIAPLRSTCSARMISAHTSRTQPFSRRCVAAAT